MRNKTILVVAAHPDDEILGCGATITRLVKEGDCAYTLVLGEGVTGRDPVRNRASRGNDLARLKHQMEKANKIIGVKKVFYENFPDNRFDTVARLDIIKKIEAVKRMLKPQVIFTHYYDDLNIDHQIIYQAVVTATRPTQDEPVREIYSFEVMSSTEWAYPLTFHPDTYVDVAATIDLKLKAMAKYVSEIKDYPHPRSLTAIKLNARNWGIKVGVKYAEVFQTIRVVR